MARVRNRDTAAEMAIRRELHRRGRRYFVQRTVGSRQVDIIFPTAKVAVMVDGCFWHSCPIHATPPKTNAGWWADKLARNVARDAQTNELLEAAGWTVLRVWEHEAAPNAADRIEAALAGSSGTG
jgi:DNA mismatch endonuclease (patch repair protein)